MNLNETIENWGLPDYFKGKKFTLNFTKDTLEIKDKNGELKFEMTVICHENVPRAFAGTQKREEIDLQYIHVVDPSDRKKGVASFYLSKLVELCKKNSITSVTIGVAKNSETSEGIKNENCLTYQELIKFYKKHLEKDLAVNFID